jgi:hypothetical protein
VVPYIEDHKEALVMYKDNPGRFWARWLDEEDAWHKEIPAICVDGAHRRHVSKEMKLAKMRVCFLQPTISVAELVLS